MKKKIMRVVLVLVIIILVSFSIWVNITYSPDTTALRYMVNSQKVSVQEEDFGISFIPSEPKNKSGVIFYPGAKVESKAYSPLAFKLAEKGYLVTIVDMPFNLAVLDVDKGKEVINHYVDVEEWYIGGHSLGGAMAGSFAYDYKGLIDGVFFLGAYPVEDLSDSKLDVLLINGSLDSIIDDDRLEGAKELIPDDGKNIILQGANHSQFGAYGLQKNDQEAEISFEEQQKQTLELIINLLENKH
jgi:dienelactone hydrolase